MSGLQAEPGEEAGSNMTAGSRQVKLVLLGDQAVGKSSLALRFVRGEFPDQHEATVGAAYLPQTMKVGDMTLKLEIWDTAGQERFNCLAPMYYRGADAAIVVYDVTNSNTFARALAWVKELRQQNAGSVLIVLAGNKADLAAEHRAVSVDEARAFAEDNVLIFTEVSAKTGTAVNEVFTTIARKLAHRSEEILESLQSQARMHLREEKRGGGGCKC